MSNNYEAGNSEEPSEKYDPNRDSSRTDPIPRMSIKTGRAERNRYGSSIAVAVRGDTRIRNLDDPNHPHYQAIISTLKDNHTLLTLADLLVRTHIMPEDIQMLEGDEGTTMVDPAEAYKRGASAGAVMMYSLVKRLIEAKQEEERAAQEAKPSNIEGMSPLEMLIELKELVPEADRARARGYVSGLYRFIEQAPAELDAARRTAREAEETAREHLNQLVVAKQLLVYGQAPRNPQELAQDTYDQDTAAAVIEAELRGRLEAWEKHPEQFKSNLESNEPTIRTLENYAYLENKELSPEVPLTE